MKRSDEQYMTNFAHYKTLFTMEKDKSMNRIYFLTNDKEEWFIDVVTATKRSGKISLREIILKPQIKRWTEYYEENGYHLTKD